MKILFIIFILFTGFCRAQSPVIYSKNAYTIGQTAPNLPPTANAGIDKTITLPTSSTTFFGSVTAGTGTIFTYLWVQVSGPSSASLTGATTATMMAGTLIQGTYTFTFTVTDNFTLTDTDTVSVFVNPAVNIPPVANAGADSTITLPVSQSGLVGTASDADGTIVSTVWTQIGSSPSVATITNGTTLTPTVSNLIEGTYNFLFTVTDNSGGTATDIVRVIVNPAIPPVNVPPVANAGSNIVITAPTSTTTLDGSGSTDSDGTITTYAWVKLSGAGGSITSPSSVTTGLTGLTQGVYQYQLTVTDNNGATDSDIVQVTVNGATNVAPTANAGPDKTRALPSDTATLFGSGTDTDGTIVSYLWTKVSGPSVYTINSPTSATTVISGMEAGVFVFQLRVTDNSGAVGVDVVTVTVNAAASPNTGAITFNLDTISRVSIGIYGYSDSVKIADIVSDTLMAAGSHTVYWTGRNDTGAVIPFPAAKYMVKILSNNVRYDWLKTIGNNSTNQIGETKYRGYYFNMTGLAFSSTHGYYSTGYSEGSPSLGKFSISTPNQKTSFFTTLTQTGDQNFVATDDTLVYWGAFDSNAGNNTFAWASRVTDDDTAILANTVNYTGVFHRTYPTIGYLNQANSFITGLAVQKTGSLLLIARAALDQIKVVNKRTAALIANTTLDSVRGISVDQNNKLWAISGSGTVSRYSVNESTGALTLELTLIGVTNPLSTGCGGTLVGVLDGTTSQVKFYNISTGTATITLGTAGGYSSTAASNRATVTDSKFDFRARNNFIAFQQDGNYWVNDIGNFRVQKYNSSNVWQNRIMSMGAVYSTGIDVNDISRVFASSIPPYIGNCLLEFDVDYVNQTWTLVKNWGKTIPSNYNLKYDINFQTLSNGRTYGLIPRGGVREILELTAGDTVRYTGLTKQNSRLSPDGSILVFTRGTAPGGISTYNSFALTGFSSGNPTWSASATNLFTTPALSWADPNSLPRTISSPITSTDKVVMFDDHPAQVIVGNRITVAKPGHAIGAFQKGTNTWLWKHAVRTHLNYRGDYPNAGFFDAGNLVNDFAGGGQTIVDRNVVWSYHGEFWKNLQTNQFSHLLDNGLVVGGFGTNRFVVGRGVHADSAMAGNVLTAQMIKEPTTGNLQLIHGDESDHAGLGWWVISRLNTIRQQNIVLDFPSAYVAPSVNYTDLMSGLPFDRTLTNNTAGWTRSPATDNTVNLFTQDWTVNLSVLKYRKLWTSDIYIKFANPTALTNTVSRDLGTNNVANDWTISGTVNFGTQLNGSKNNMFIDVLDDAGKVLTTFYATAVGGTLIKGNTVTVTSFTRNSSTLVPFNITIEAGVVSFSYNGSTPVTTIIFDGTGDWHKPKTLRARLVANSTGTNNNVKLGFADLRLYLDTL